MSNAQTNLSVTSPFTGKEIDQLPMDDMGALQQKLDRASQTLLDRDNWLSIVQRQEILSACAEKLKTDYESFAQLIALEGAKPIKDARVEALRAADGVMLCVDHLKQDLGHVVNLGTSALTVGHSARTYKEPIGIVAAVSAFNHPLNLIVHQVAPAIAAGCPVIIKPAPDTPLSCVKFVDLLYSSGLPKQWCQTLITDDLDVSEALVTNPNLGFFSFIGSARVGWMLRSKLAPGVRCALEHGGAAPAILTPSADLETAVPALVKGGYYHAGQVCVSVQRVYVPNAQKQALIDLLLPAIAKLGVGDPQDDTVDVGPLIRPAEVDRVETWVQNAKAQGAHIACGGNRVNDRVFAPTLIVDPPFDCEVSKQEIFGPVVCIYGYDNINDAIHQANDVPFSFQAAVFAQDIDEAYSTAAKLNGSAIMVNEHTAFRDDVMPFAGLKQSGLGVGGIPHTIEDMQINKMVVLKTAMQ